MNPINRFEANEVTRGTAWGHQFSRLAPDIVAIDTSMLGIKRVRVIQGPQPGPSICEREPVFVT